VSPVAVDNESAAFGPYRLNTNARSNVNTYLLMPDSVLLVACKVSFFNNVPHLE
jgi:hypothetical protein